MSSNKRGSYWALVPAAGGGSRMGAARPKQYLPLGGRAVLEWSLKPFLDAGWIKGVVVVLAAGDRRFARLPIAKHPKVSTVIGGATRAASVLAGLGHLQDRGGGPRPYVLIHDAARPCVQARDLRRLRDLASDRHGGLLAARVVDTLKQSRLGRVDATLDRESIWRAQTPQMFRLDLLQPALKLALDRGNEVTDDAAAMQAAGFRPRLVEAPASNLKITYPEDLALAEFWLGRHKAAP